MGGGIDSHSYPISKASIPQKTMPLNNRIVSLIRGSPRKAPKDICREFLSKNNLINDTSRNYFELNK